MATPSIKDFVKRNLLPLADQVGGPGVVSKLPTETIIVATAHTDDVLAITTDDWVIDVPDMDAVVGYEVYDKHYELLYNEDEELGLEYDAWGTTERDVYLLWILAFGDYVYLTYKVKDEDTERVLLLIKF